MTLKKTQIYLLSFSSAAIIANIYYSQPLLAHWAKTFHVSESSAGQVFFCGVLGMALGAITLIPLGDKLKRKKFILWTIGINIVMVFLVAMSWNITVLKVFMLIVGFFSIGPQLIVPLAVDLSTKENRTKVVGIIISGLLFGAIFARLIGGSITAWFNWRFVYILSTGLMIITFIFIYRFIPESQPKYKGTYGDILKSLWKIFRQQRQLRVAILLGASCFVLSRAFWVTIAFLLAGEPFNMNTDAIGLFGLVTLAGAFNAPVVGRLSNRFSADKIIMFGIMILAIAFLLLFFFPFALLLVVAGGGLMEGGRQLIQVTMQSEVISHSKEARSRLNMLYITGGFAGSALGAALGLIAWHWGKWDGVCYVAFIVVLFQSIIFAKDWFKVSKQKSNNSQKTLTGGIEAATND